MLRSSRRLALLLAAPALLALSAARGEAQTVIVPAPTVTYYSPPVVSYYYAPPAVSYYYAPPAVVAPPAAVTTYRYGVLPRRRVTVTTYAPPAVTYYAPPVVVTPRAARYYAPAYVYP
jgi:hypothetical protein